jgi:hypothetical protein
MKLLADWKNIIKKAWSMRLMALAGVLTGGETIIQLYGADWLPSWLPQWARLLTILGVIVGANIARVLYQKSMNRDPAE